MQLQYRVLLVHNPFDRRDALTYLSKGIRFATESHWNHTAIELTLGGTVWVVESVGKGVIATKKEKWLRKSNRHVLVLEPSDGSRMDSDELIGYMGQKYGVLDILQLAKYLAVRKYWDENYTWDGERGTRLWKGIFCSELAALLMHLPNPHLTMPCDFLKVPQLKVADLYSTRKGIGYTGWTEMA